MPRFKFCADCGLVFCQVVVGHRLIVVEARKASAVMWVRDCGGGHGPSSEVVVLESLGVGVLVRFPPMAFFVVKINNWQKFIEI